MADIHPRVLLVEEDEVLADVTSFRLELLGYDVTCVRRGDEALKHVREGNADVVILDTHLPDMDGVEVINRLSSGEDTSHIPVLVFSTDADLDAVQRAYHAGARDYLVTPYNPAVLEQKLEKLLNLAVPTTSRVAGG